MTNVLEKCPVCGAILDEEDLFCANCGTVAPQNKDQQKPPVAHEVTCNFVCKGCGASMSYDARCGALRCPFCGSTELAKQPDAKEIAPDGVVPFVVQQADAIATMRKWLGASFWRPGDLSEQALVVSMTPVYVPYWVFQAQTHTYWTADSSHTPPGARSSWFPTSGQHEGECDGLLVGASSVLTAAETSAICPFDLAPALPPDKVDLVNATFERFTVPRKYARPLANQGFEEFEREACQQYVPGKARNMHVNVRITDLTSRPMLLPVWIMAYRYQDRVFRFLANGQTGHATGQAPTSWRKIAAVVIIVAIVILLLLMLLAHAAGGQGRRFGFEQQQLDREAGLRFRAPAATGILPIGQRPCTSCSEFARSESCASRYCKVPPSPPTSLCLRKRTANCALSGCATWSVSARCTPGSKSPSMPLKSAAKRWGIFCSTARRAWERPRSPPAFRAIWA
jgi:hypothetical protein